MENSFGELADFTREQQIRYTCKHYIPYMVESAKNPLIRARLASYQEINEASVKKLEEKEENSPEDYFTKIEKRQEGLIRKCCK